MDARQVKIIASDGDLSMEDLIPDEDLVVSITRGGYAKRTRADQYRTQKRGGKGVRGATLRGDDVVEHFISTTNHHWLLFFTTAGFLQYREAVDAAPARPGRTSRSSPSRTRRRTPSRPIWSKI